VELFYVVNGWAGRVAWVDEAARLFYVGALPLLWSAVAWLLLLAPRSWAAFSRRRILAASGLALLGAFGLWQGLEWASRTIWSTPIFSSRPFVTHWVNLLIVEPNDNSYPCIEVLVAAIGATLCWAASLRAGALAWGWTLLYGFVRIFCGSNYPIDILAGWALGWGLSAFSLALWRVPLRIPARDGGRLKWRQRPQAVLSLTCIALVLGAALIELLGAPQALRHPNSLLAGSHVAASPAVNVAASTSALAQPKPTPGALPLDGEYGRQPNVEAVMRKALEQLRLAHRIVDVEVAQATVGGSIYRVAAASFEVQPARAGERKEATRSAARIARACFAADPRTQNVDVLGVIFPNRPTGESFGEGGGAAVPAEIKPLPIFTASIQRKNLILSGKLVWANWSLVDPGLWLRTRSRLFIDPDWLPYVAPTPHSAAKPRTTPKPVVPAKPIVPLVPPKLLAPRVVPHALPHPAPSMAAKPQPRPALKLAPKPQAKLKAVAKPKAVWKPKTIWKPPVHRQYFQRPPY